MGRNHTPDCHTNAWTGASGYKVYDPFCPVCEEERRRADFWTILLSAFAFTLGILGFITGVIGLIRSSISP